MKSILNEKSGRKGAAAAGKKERTMLNEIYPETRKRRTVAQA
jgi:hypothetical protein